MPTFIKRDRALENSLIDNGGLHKNTLQKRKLYASYFQTFLENERPGVSIEDLMHDKILLENILIGYFSSIRVTKNGNTSLPSRSSFDANKSHLHMFFKEQNEGIDILDQTLFPKLHKLIKGLRYIKKL